MTQANPPENTRLMAGDIAGDIVVLIGSRVQIRPAMELLVQMGAK